VTVAIDLFIAWYLLVVTVAQSAPGRRLFAPFDVVIDGLGLRQHWAMFAPDPAGASTRLYVVIQLRSGQQLRWDRDQRLTGSWEGFIGFRRRLFTIMLATVGGSAARRSFAGYLVRTYGVPGDPPATVTFMRTRLPVPPLGGDPVAAGDHVVEVFQAAELDGIAAHAG
jgi:hypothetical protein